MRDDGVGEYSSECSHRNYGFMFPPKTWPTKKNCAVIW